MGFQDPSLTVSVVLDSTFQRAQKPSVLQPVPVYDSASLADQHQEPIFNSVIDSATGSVSHQQSFQHTFAHQVASSTAPVFQTP